MDYPDCLGAERPFTTSPARELPLELKHLRVIKVAAVGEPVTHEIVQSRSKGFPRSPRIFLVRVQTRFCWAALSSSCSREGARLEPASLTAQEFTPMPLGKHRL